MLKSSSLVKLQFVVALILLICASPILLLAAILFKTFVCLQTWLINPRKNLKDEVALVTGAAHGLGRNIALELAKLGCHLAIADIDLNGAKETAKQINQLYKVRAMAYKVNVANYTEIVELKANIAQDLGPVTVLVNNAGIMINKSTEPDDIQRMIAVNLASHFWTKNIFLPTMKQLRKGHIVTISSLSSIVPIPFHTCYSATKFGATGHMRALRMELAFEGHNNIHVCTALPWFLKTNDDVSDLCKQTLVHYLYPLLSGSDAAHRIVQGMLCGEREIVLPGMFAIMYRIFYLLPIGWQEYLLLFIAHKQFQKFSEMQ